jgi:glycosyltransferase involved in cell wall biosynthesis
MMKILMVTERYIPIWGGAENQLRQLIPYLVEKQAEIAIVTRKWQKGWSRKEMINGTIVYRLGFAGQGIVATVFFITHLLWFLMTTGKGYDLLHSHGAAKMGVMCRLAILFSAQKNVVKIATAGKLSGLKRSAVGKALLFFFKKSDAVVAMTDEIREELDLVGFPPERIITIPNGVDCQRFYKETSLTARNDVRKRLGCPEKAKLVLFSGRLVYRKGLDILLKAWQVFAAGNQDYYLLVIGSGDLQPDSVEMEMKRLVSDNQIERVVFAGETEVPELLLANSDMFVFPSRREGFPNALMEAMAAGLPVIVSNIGGNTDLVTNGRTGMIFRSEDSAALATLLADAAGNSDIESLGLSAREYVCSHYGFSFIAREYYSLYIKLLNAG